MLICWVALTMVETNRVEWDWSVVDRRKLTEFEGWACGCFRAAENGEAGKCLTIDIYTQTPLTLSLAATVCDMLH